MAYQNRSKQYYTQREVNAIFSYIPYRTLISLAKENVVESEVDFGDHRGIHRKYTLAHLSQIAVVTTLAASGWVYSSIKEVIADPYLKGVDNNGNPKILEIMNKYMVLRIVDIDIDSSSIFKEKRELKYFVDFFDNINLLKQIDDLDLFFKFPREIGLFRTTTSMIIDLPALNAYLLNKIDLFLAHQESLVKKMTAD